MASELYYSVRLIYSQIAMKTANRTTTSLSYNLESMCFYYSRYGIYPTQDKGPPILFSPLLSHASSISSLSHKRKSRLMLKQSIDHPPKMLLIAH